MSSSDGGDVIVAGSGIVALACARALTAAGADVQLVGRRHPGFASMAAAGLLAPTIEATHGGALAFALAARDRYPSYVQELRESTGHDIPCALDGILRVPSGDADERALRDAASPWAHWIEASDVASLEPALLAPRGALLHQHDGFVDNQRLFAALDAAVSRTQIRRREQNVRAVAFSHHGARVDVDDGSALSAPRLVLAAGAWLPLIAGLPAELPITPLRGQMMSLAGTPVARPVYGRGGYLAPRPADAATLVGSTSERTGFALGTTDEALARFRALAAELSKEFARAPQLAAWSGLRPMTPDSLPIIGADAEHTSLIYACGHSRNGILMAPLTGEVVTALALGHSPGFDLAPFSLSRFARTDAAPYPAAYGGPH